MKNKKKQISDNWIFFYGTSGEPITFTNWDLNNFNQSGYGEMSVSDKKWGFDPGSSQHKIIL